jgi:Subtilase family
MPWRVALIDSGAEDVIRSRRFADDGVSVRELPVLPDASGHGTAMARVIRSAGVASELLLAQVMGEDGRTTPAAVAAALDWVLEQGARLIHLSLGLSRDRAVLAEAVARVLAAGVIVVASAPVRGQRTYPAAYAGVISATGDARCAPDDISYRPVPGAEFGGCPHHACEGAALRGASVGAAHVTRAVLAHLAPTVTSARASELLSRRAAWRGPEQRRQRSLPDH